MPVYTQTRKDFRAALINYNPDHFDVYAVEDRFLNFYISLLKKRNGYIVVEDDIPFDDIGNDELMISDAIRRKISNRARLFSTRASAKLGIDHLKKEDRDRLKSILPSVSMSYIDETSADALASDLHDRFPWMPAATEHVWSQLRKSARNGDPAIVSPLLLEGPPGIGKSAWARALAKALCAPHTSIDASISNAGFSVAGTEKGWGSAQAGRPVELIIQHNHGGPVVVVDEVCKSGVANTSKGQSVSITNSLLSLLEPISAKNFECPFHRVPFDLSRVSWILTANYIENVPHPLKTRCAVVRCDGLTTDHLQLVASRLAHEARLDEPAMDAAMEAVARLAGVVRRPVDLRDVRRIIDRAEALQMRPLLN